MKRLIGLLTGTVCALFAAGFLSACSLFQLTPDLKTVEMQATPHSAGLVPGTFEFRATRLDGKMRRAVVNALREHGFTEAKASGKSAYLVDCSFGYTNVSGAPEETAMLSIFQFSIFGKDGGRALWQVNCSCCTPLNRDPRAYADMLIACSLEKFNTGFFGQVECESVRPFYKKMVK